MAAQVNLLEIRKGPIPIVATKQGDTIRFMWKPKRGRWKLVTANFEKNSIQFEGRIDAKTAMALKGGIDLRAI